MPGKRRDSQKVETFTAGVDLLHAAQVEAKARRMTKSGFYRYCLAKELGMNEEQAMRVAEHANIGNFAIVQPGSTVTQNAFTSASAPAQKPAKYPKRGRKKKTDE